MPAKQTFLSETQKRILDFIRTSLHENGYPPSMRQIGAAAGLKSLSSISYQLTKLENAGHIRREAGKPRALEIINEQQETNQQTPHSEETKLVPLVGQIAAGTPITAEQHIDEILPLPKQLVGSGTLFMLKVVGDSMIDAAICDGDYVVVREQKEATNGDIVAALLDDEATVKVFRKRDGHTWLLPQNTAYEPILGDHASILGKIVAVLRSI